MTSTIKAVDHKQPGLQYLHGEFTRKSREVSLLEQSRAGTDFRANRKRAKGLLSGPKKGSSKLEKKGVWCKPDPNRGLYSLNPKQGSKGLSVPALEKERPGLKDPCYLEYIIHAAIHRAKLQ